MARNSKSRKLRNRKMRGGVGWFCGTSFPLGCSPDEIAAARANKSGAPQNSTEGAAAQNSTEYAAAQESEDLAKTSSRGAVRDLPPMTHNNLKNAATEAGIGTRIDASGGGKFRGGKSNRRRNKKSKKSRRTRRR
jgi:hypothetical protein